MEEKKVITVANVSTCTAYELRQELVRRKAFDLNEDKVNFRSLLQRLMTELVKEEEIKAATQLTEQEAIAAIKRDEAKRERERKKTEALERSKLRQADPAYLEAKKKTTIQSVSAIEALGDAAKDEPMTSQTEADTTIELEREQVDVFRSYQSKSRNKIFVK
jgi:hypothetical protein